MRIAVVVVMLLALGTAATLFFLAEPRQGANSDTRIAPRNSVVPRHALSPVHRDQAGAREGPAHIDGFGDSPGPMPGAHSLPASATDTTTSPSGPTSSGPKTPTVGTPALVLTEPIGETARVIREKLDGRFKINGASIEALDIDLAELRVALLALPVVGMTSYVVKGADASANCEVVIVRSADQYDPQPAMPKSTSGAAGANGANGSDGADGSDGVTPGMPGQHGSQGEHGYRGHYGGMGTEGIRGVDGVTPSLWEVVLERRPLPYVAIVIGARGQDGGAGGDGGDGGVGGTGGTGGDGGRGGYGHPGNQSTPPASSGNPGDGGQGGSGGHGGHGGYGGTGGRGGDGQSILVTAKNAWVLVLPGDGGAGGNGGNGGKPGAGGPGGLRGWNGQMHLEARTPPDSARGQGGNSGKPGHGGRGGKPGQRGEHGRMHYSSHSEIFLCECPGVDGTSGVKGRDGIGDSPGK